MKRVHSSSAIIEEESTPWILDNRFSRSTETKYFKTMDLFWHIKECVACAMEHKRNKNNQILNMLGKLGKKV
jgi:Zn-finger protein